MIAPRARLLWAFALIAWPAITLLALLPAVAPACLFVLAAFAIFAIGDAVFSRDRLRNLRVEAPEVVRFAKGREGTVELWLSDERLEHPATDGVVAAAVAGGRGERLSMEAAPSAAEDGRQLQLRLALPSEFTSENEEQRVTLPAAGGGVASFACTSSQRGRFTLEEMVAQTSSALGLWNVRKTIPIAAELRVYPDLLSERQNLAAIFLHRGNAGVRPIRRVGKGRDFEQLRDYIAGDSAEDIHWKATAKRGRPVTKVFQVEQTQEVYVVIDASRLSARMAGGLPMLEHFINCALILCLAAGQRSDLFGLTTFTDKVQSFVRAKNGKAHYNLCRDTLYRLQPARVTPDFGDLFTFLRLRLRRRALLVFLTALDDPALAAGFIEKIDLLSRQHLVLVNMLRPSEANPVFARGNVASVSEIYRQLGGHLVWHDLRELGKRLHHHGVRLSLVDHATLTPDVIAQYLQVKQRQLI